MTFPINVLLGVCLVGLLSVATSSEGSQGIRVKVAAASNHRQVGTADKLSHHEEACVRDLVFNGKKMIYMPTSGDLILVNLLYVPKDLKGLYGRKPSATLQMLRDIVKGASPKDASLAAGFAYALVVSPMAGAAKGRYPLKHFDAVIEVRGMTFREVVVSEIEEFVRKSKQ